MAFDPERVLFNKVGWMKYYGYLDEEGGPAETAEPGEASNFHSFDGKYYGLVHSKSPNIQRLGGSRDHRSIRHVLVVSVAPHPSSGEYVVVGWQPESWVLGSNKKRKDGRVYNYQGKLANAVLLPEESRIIEVPSGKEGMGLSKLAYGCDAKGKPRAWLKGILHSIDNYDGENLVS